MTGFLTLSPKWLRERQSRQSRLNTHDNIQKMFLGGEMVWDMKSIEAVGNITFVCDAAAVSRYVL